MVTDFPCMWVFVPENIQKPSHHGPRHPALCGLFWAGEIGPGDFMRSLQTWARWSFLASKRREGMLSGSQQLAEVQQDREEQAICNQQLIGGGLAKVWKMTLDVPKWDEEFVRVTKTWAWVPCQIELFSFDLDCLSWILNSFSTSYNDTCFPCCRNAATLGDSSMPWEWGLSGEKAGSLPSLPVRWDWTFLLQWRTLWYLTLTGFLH